MTEEKEQQETAPKPEQKAGENKQPATPQAAQKEKAEEAKGSVKEKPAAKGRPAAKERAAAAAKERPAPARRKAVAKEEEKPREPSKNQPLLDKYVQVIKNHFEEDVIEEAYINWESKEIPTLVIKKEHWFRVAQFLKHNEQMAFDYLSNLAGVDQETHMEVCYHFYSYKEKQSLAVKVKTDREEASVPSITPIWPGADWPERETYDLLGIRFTDHPNLKRILLTDDWVGHPLRKDYVPYDEGI